MLLRWRWSLVVVLAAMVFAGFMPQALLAGTHTPASMPVISTAGPPTFPSGCAGASCAKGSPAAPTPTVSIAALAAAIGVLAGAAALQIHRRYQSHARALPRGVVTTLFRPPQFA